MRNSAAQELITAEQVSIPASPPAAEPGLAVLPVVGLLSLLGHGVVLAGLAMLPAPVTPIAAAAAPVEIIPIEPVAPEPAPEPVVVPPPPVVEEARVVERPRPRRRAVVPEEEVSPDPDPAPPSEVMAAETPGEGTWAHTAGDPNGVLGGEAGAEGTGTTSTPAPVAPAAEPGISREQLRRMLIAYIRGTLSRYLNGRIDYPLAARREQIQGVVLLRIRLAEDGRILAVRLSRTSGHGILDRAALAQVQALGSMPAPPPEIPWDPEQELPLPVTYVLQ